MIDLNRLMSEAFADLRNDDSYSDSEWWLRVEIEYLRKDGVSFALETRDREPDDFFRRRFLEAVRPEFEFELNRLFVGSEEEEPVVPDYDLARFWLLKVRGVSYFDLRSNPFDAAYDLIERLGLRSAQPDIPFTENLGGGPTPPTRVLASKTLDRAWSLREQAINRRTWWPFVGEVRT